MPDDTLPAKISDEQTIAALRQIIDQLNAKIDALNAQLAPANAALQQKYYDTLTARYDEQIALLKATAELYNWQNFASNVMLYTVVTVVFAGLIFSGYQLYYAVHLNGNTNGEFDLSTTGLKVTSSVVGVIILAMSIAFVLIFVDKVYTIKPSPQIDVVHPTDRGQAGAGVR